MRWMKCWAKTARRASLSGAATCLLILALLGGIAHSQDPTQDSTQEPTLRSQSNVVLVPALVKDAQSGIVYGLLAKDFIVEDDGVPQATRLDETPDGQPISLV